MKRIVFVHGSVIGGRPTWSRQDALGARYALEIVERPGFPPHPPVERIDYDEEAQLLADALRDGDHLVGHSYGGVICLLAAALRPGAVSSLTVIEPPALHVARGDPVVDAFTREGEAWWRDGPRDDPEAFLRGFLRYIQSDYDPPSPLPQEVMQGAQMLMVERGPWTAEIPLPALAAAPFPTLVVSGGHHPAFDAVCDVLEQELEAERLVLTGYGHTAQRHPAFNERLAEFIDSSTAARSSAL